MSIAEYARDYDPESARGSAVRLVRDAALPSGVVLDLGCGFAPAAGPLTELGLSYVGADVDDVALAWVAERGIEAHRLDLRGSADEVLERVRAVLAGRAVAAVLALDVLEHLPEPEQVTRAVRSLADDHPAMRLVVSLPNVTHFDVAAKLLLGRWDITDAGLLERTHLRFFSAVDHQRLLAAEGWELEARDDVVSEFSDQRFPADVPVLRTELPAYRWLRRLRDRAEPSGSIYQFVWRFAPGERRPDLAATVEAEPARPLVTVVVRDAAGAASVTHDDRVEVVAAGSGWAGVAEALDRAQGRYLCVVGPDDQLPEGWVDAVAELAEAQPGRLVRLGAEVDGEPVRQDPLDLAHDDVPGAIVPAAWLVPGEVVRSTGVRLDPGLGAAAYPAFLAEAAVLCGVLPVDEPAVVSDVADVLDVEALWDLVAEQLDEAPLLLQRGSAARLVALRRRRYDLAAQVHHLGDAVELERAYHRQSIEAKDAERAEVEAELAEVAALAELERQQRWAVQERLTELDAELVEAHERLAAIHGSRTWRLRARVLAALERLRG